MKPPGFLRRWMTYRRLFKGPPAAFVHRWSGQRPQQLQRAAAREAYLATQPKDRRVLTAPSYGDTH